MEKNNGESYPRLSPHGSKYDIHDTYIYFDPSNFQIHWKPTTKFIQRVIKTPLDLGGLYETDAGKEVLYKEIRVDKYGRDLRAVLTFDQKTYRKKMFTLGLAKGSVGWREMLFSLHFPVKIKSPENHFIAIKGKSIM